MLRNVRILAVLMLAVFAVSCASKKKSGEGDGSGADSAEISQEALNFNPQGSDSGEIQGLNTVFFAYDSSTLDKSARDVLTENAKWMKARKNLTIQIEGHCDGRGSVEYNLALGERRAQAVKDYLRNLGVEAQRMTIISYGKEKLLDLGDTDSAHAKNRRANFVPLAN